jgi:hypothetical protein
MQEVKQVSLWRWVSQSVCPAIIEQRTPVTYEVQEFFFFSHESKFFSYKTKSKTKVLVFSIWWGLSYCILNWQKGCKGKRGRPAPTYLFYKATNPFIRTSPLWLSHLLKSSPLNTITLVIKFQHVNLGEHTQTTAMVTSVWVALRHPGGGTNWVSHWRYMSMGGDNNWICYVGSQWLFDSHPCDCGYCPPGTLLGGPSHYIDGLFTGSLDAFPQ